MGHNHNRNTGTKQFTSEIMGNLSLTQAANVQQHNAQAHNTPLKHTPMQVPHFTPAPTLGKLGDAYDFDDAPQAIKATKSRAGVMKNLELSGVRNGLADVLVDLRKIGPTSKGKSDLYATGQIKYEGFTIGINVTRPYEHTPKANANTNWEVCVVSLAQLLITIDLSNLIGLSSTEKNNLYAKGNVQLEVGKRGWFTISVNAYKAIGV